MAKDYVKFLDFFISISLLRRHADLKVNFIYLCVFVILLFFSIRINFGGLNQNAIGSVILFLIYLITQNRAYVPKLKVLALSGLALFSGSLTLFIVSFQLIFGFKLQKFIYLFNFLILTSVIVVFEEFLSISRFVLGTLFMRIDLWIHTIRRFASLEINNILFGAPTVFERYFNEKFKFSDFIFTGVDPHNIIILFLTKFGVIFTIVCLLTLMSKVWLQSNRYILLWIVVAFLEPVFSFNYFGVLALVWNWKLENAKKV